MRSRDAADLADAPMWNTKVVWHLVTLAIGTAFSIGVSYSVINVKQETSEKRLTKIEDDREQMKRDYFERMGKMETSVQNIDKNVDRILKKLDE